MLKVIVMERKVIQISISAAQSSGQFSGWTEIAALCNDGVILTYNSEEEEWAKLPPIPQPEISADDVVAVHAIDENNPQIKHIDFGDFCEIE